MRRLSGITSLLLLVLSLSPRAAGQAFAEPDWAIEARFPGVPKSDGILTPSPQGDVKVRRFFWDQGLAAICADNPTVEVWPYFPWKPTLHWAIARLGPMSRWRCTKLAKGCWLWRRRAINI